MSRQRPDPPPSDHKEPMPREEPAVSLVRLIPPTPPAPESSPQHSIPDSGRPSGEVLRGFDLDSLFRRYSPYVAAIAYRLLGREEDVDDTIQEVFLAAVRGVHAVRDPAAVRAWLARVTVRAARQRLRKRRLRSFLGLDEPATYDAVVDRGASAEQRALVARVYRVLDGLPANQRIAWSLRYIEGEALESVASLTGCSLATAKRRIAAAALELEEAFSDG
jgi:RNA polymerase sigma-70 factor (ECF subfamily)